MVCLARICKARHNFGRVGVSVGGTSLGLIYRAAVVNIVSAMQGSQVMPTKMLFLTQISQHFRSVALAIRFLDL